MITHRCMFTTRHNISRRFSYNHTVLNFTTRYLAIFQPVTHSHTNTAILVKELLGMLKVLKKPSVS